MLARLHHQLERTVNCATLYLTGRLHCGDELTLLRLVSGLPHEVRTLRLDLHALGDVDESTIERVKPLLRHWRAQRAGAVHLSLRTRNPSTSTETKLHFLHVARADEDAHALMATYL